MRKYLARRLHHRGERGYAAVLIAIMLPVVLIALAATAVDTARWYVEVQRVQNAADAGSLAGVTYMPQDVAGATSMAKTVTSRNGYTDGVNGVKVAAVMGGRPSQLKVTVTSTVDNLFGKLIGVPTTTISRSSTSDYLGPAPMGSPCNTFGNEPSTGGGPSSLSPAGSVIPAASQSACSSAPDFWATIEGPETDKTYGDRYSTMKCSSGVQKCHPPTNDEYNPLGYFWIIKVDKNAVGHPIEVQLYDPQFTYTNLNCSALPAASALSNDMNPWVKTDGKARYGNGNGTTDSVTHAPYCTGDFYTSMTYPFHPMTTSFEVRDQTDTADPMQGAVESQCVKQYDGTGAKGSGQTVYGSTPYATGQPTVNDLLNSVGSTTYKPALAQVFHNWTSLCTFTPTREGDYYLHARTNVSTGGTKVNNVVYTGNPAVSGSDGNTDQGEGDNSFGIRLVTDAASADLVSVAGYDRMPIFNNAPATSSTINLIRVLPGAAGQAVAFSFFDAGDTANQSAGDAGTITVVPPADATGSVQTTPFPGGCVAVGGYAGSSPGAKYSNCSAPVTHQKNNGQVEDMAIPIPADYNCNYNSPLGCWYKVTVSMNGPVSDITTWDASIVGDPVRLIK